MCVEEKGGGIMRNSAGSMYKENLDVLHLCDFALAVVQYLDEVGEATAEEISAKCNIPMSRINESLSCVKQTGYVVSRGRKTKRYALRYKDPELSYLWQKEDKAK